MYTSMDEMPTYGPLRERERERERDGRVVATAL